MRKSDLSEAQRDVLESYARGEPKQRGNSNFTLRQRGLLTFVWRHKDGRFLTLEDLRGDRSLLTDSEFSP